MQDETKRRKRRNQKKREKQQKEMRGATEKGLRSNKEELEAIERDIRVK
jgi:hypothetical protein